MNQEEAIEKDEIYKAMNVFVDSLTPEERPTTNRHDFYVRGYRDGKTAALAFASENQSHGACHDVICNGSGKYPRYDKSVEICNCQVGDYNAATRSVDERTRQAVEVVTRVLLELEKDSYVTEEESQAVRHLLSIVDGVKDKALAVARNSQLGLQADRTDRRREILICTRMR